MHVSLTAAYAAQQSAPPPLAPPGLPPETGDRWSLTDLLARASRDEDGTTRAQIINIESIARALDPSTAAAIWSRFRAGQRGIMVRSIYTAEGRTAFDEVLERYKNELDFHRTVDRYLTDFEWLLRNVEQKDPSGARCRTISSPTAAACICSWRTPVVGCARLTPPEHDVVADRGLGRELADCRQLCHRARKQA
jgi:hypothetical protein